MQKTKRYTVITKLDLWLFEVPLFASNLNEARFLGMKAASLAAIEDLHISWRKTYRSSIENMINARSYDELIEEWGSMAISAVMVIAGHSQVSYGCDYRVDLDGNVFRKRVHYHEEGDIVNIEEEQKCKINLTLY